MKWLWLLSLSFSVSAWASYCQCELYAVHPISASNKTEIHTIDRMQGKYYGIVNAATARECRQDCAALTQQEYTEEVLQEKLTPWVDELVNSGLAGYNCTGPTSFKVPVRVRATLQSRSLGIARQSMVFIHRNRSCFI
mgnify:CR=1 FL=1